MSDSHVVMRKRAFITILLPCCIFLLQAADSTGAVPSCVFMAQQDDSGKVLSAFVSEMTASAAGFSYSYVIDDGRTEIMGEGTVEMQGESYIVKGNGLEIISDGMTRWTVDRQSMEAVVESCDPENPDFTVNPAVLLRHFYSAFSVSGHDRTASGYDYVLVPVSSDTDISSLELGLSADGSALLSAVLKMKDGTVADFTVRSFAFSAPSDPGRFHFDPSSLSSDYIITDLR